MDVPGEVQSILWEAWAILRSGPAQRILVVSLSGVVLGLSLWGAYRQKTWLEGLTEDFLVVTFPGRVPTTPKGIRRRAARAKKTRSERLRELWLRIAALFVLGVLVPAVFLYLGTVFYGWFDGRTLPLADRSTGDPIPVPGLRSLCLYVADQLLRGGLFDALEVFQIPLGEIINNRLARYYSAGVLAFHLYAEVFVIFGLSYLLRAAWMLRGLLPGVTAPQAA